MSNNSTINGVRKRGGFLRLRSVAPLVVFAFLLSACDNPLASNPLGGSGADSTDPAAGIPVSAEHEHGEGEEGFSDEVASPSPSPSPSPSEGDGGDSDDGDSGAADRPPVAVVGDAVDNLRSSPVNGLNLCDQLDVPSSVGRANLGGTCSPAQIGYIPTPDEMRRPSIRNAAELRQLGVNEPFDVEIEVRDGSGTGSVIPLNGFTVGEGGGAGATLFAAGGEPDLFTHCHFGIIETDQLGGFPLRTVYDFFSGVQAVNGNPTVEVAGIPRAGFFQMEVWCSSAAHLMWPSATANGIQSFTSLPFEVTG